MPRPGSISHRAVALDVSSASPQAAWGSGFEAISESPPTGSGRTMQNPSYIQAVEFLPFSVPLVHSRLHPEPEALNTSTLFKFSRLGELFTAAARCQPPLQDDGVFRPLGLAY